jgi:hypothetical protein
MSKYCVFKPQSRKRIADVPQPPSSPQPQAWTPLWSCSFCPPLPTSKLLASEQKKGLFKKELCRKNPQSNLCKIFQEKAENELNFPAQMVSEFQQTLQEHTEKTILIELTVSLNSIYISPLCVENGSWSTASSLQTARHFYTLTAVGSTVGKLKLILCICLVMYL